MSPHDDLLSAACNAADGLDALGHLLQSIIDVADFDHAKALATIGKAYTTQHAVNAGVMACSMSPHGHLKSAALNAAEGLDDLGHLLQSIIDVADFDQAKALATIGEAYVTQRWDALNAAVMACSTPEGGAA